MDWIDIAKGIGILSVVLGHSFESLTPIIYSFHMPLFLILAGYTIKPIQNNEWIQVERKDFRRLIVPCIITRLVIFSEIVYLIIIQ